MKKTRKATRPKTVWIEPDYEKRIRAETFEAETKGLPPHDVPELLAKIHELLLRRPYLQANHDDVAAPARLRASLEAIRREVLVLQEAAGATSTGFLMEKTSRAIDFEMNCLASELKVGRPAAKDQATRLVACFMSLLLESMLATTKRQRYLWVFRIFDRVGIDHPAPTRSTAELDSFFLSRPEADFDLRLRQLELHDWLTV